jgi:predicted glycogen debranching enzyme
MTTLDSFPTLVRTASLGREALEHAEWVLTDGLGGFAMGTASGVPTRRYHGLLVASLSPPVQREVLLHSVVDRLVVAPGTGTERVYDLSSFRFRDGTVHPAGASNLVKFEVDTSARWTFRCGDGVEIVKTLRLMRHGGCAALHYRITGLSELARLEVRPLVAMRDAHELLLASEAEGEFDVSERGRRIVIERKGRVLDVVADNGFFEPGEQWWFGFKYAIETGRGLEDTEDLFSPGAFMMQVRPAAPGVSEPVEFTLLASLEQPKPALMDMRRAASWALDSERQTRQRVASMTASVLEQVRPETPEADRVAIARLVGASDAYVVRRGSDAKKPGVSIIAGYPWFSDWGRDSMISLRGLLLATRRFDEARLLLETFAAHARNGLVPNLFDDQTGQALYNTVDASLWYLHAACQYLTLTGDRSGFDGAIKNACFAIIDAYRDGTDFGIRMDPSDSLITAGDETTQLTWMDAKRDGVVFTPRHGKAVEINALWHHGLVSVATAVDRTDGARAKEFRLLAGAVGASFRKAFWYPQRGCCVDVITPAKTPAATGLSEKGNSIATWSVDARIRPNQVFAAALEHSPLTMEQRQGVVSAARQVLVTPLGLRTLAAMEKGYRPRFSGKMMERDAAYHNGTVWPWLMGTYVEAVLRAGNFSEAARAEGRQALEGLIKQLDGLQPGGSSLGQIYEVFDAEETVNAPRVAGGCMAQAWSVAETLRALLLVNGR